ncbi:hypothetical protein DVK85_07975 [Flavobacterium arcticum]|uniref:C-type lectin domain-containing protein n=1 Tax=Flavobacterium arcticum TaxID=1784713 RepID=A0A345HC71_9FLAO|nr:T9SS type B sorting domain-containing protein [Flavobacterium arcticum]AXG74181.1 hypothetical protein DVK85_07975 [Flavobacterium arcticum]KAF2508231.1 T9SS type B sorting domain-containing protein [Flavobacterium arcticum]
MNNFSHTFLRINNLKEFFFAILFFITFSQITNAQTNEAPVLTATGDQIYCPGENLNITTTFNITDTDDTATEAIYIQISSGYENGEDLLSLTGTHPNITSSWNVTTAKLSLTGTTGQDVSYTDLIAAIEDVVYTNSATNPTPGTRTFSITVGQANYLESTDHYYLYIAELGINWVAARDAAEATTYYGLQGYLATILSEDEALLIGEQALGTGWIGGSDSATEGVWQWVTGPEAGTTFWNGDVNGSTPNYAFWNTGEPNNLDNEDYAHITAPGVGVPGSWNDLSIAGGPNEYMPQGYIVEYGGMPGDPVLQLSATTTISILGITSTAANSECNSGSLTLLAGAGVNDVYWYTNATGGTPIHTGTSFNTPTITTTTTYYVSAYDETCTTAPRTPIVATIYPLPTVTAGTTPPTICGSGTSTLEATASNGVINWYDAPTGGTLIDTGNSITSPSISTTTTFYAEAVSSDNCISATRTAITITATPLPTITNFTTPPALCGSGTASLSAIPSGGTINWYDAPTDGTLIGTGTTITSPTVTTTTIFYAEVLNNDCLSENRTAVTVTVNPLPTITVATTEVSLCEEGITTLEAIPSDGVINWYDTDTGVTVLFSGNEFETPFLTENTTYYAEAVSTTNCISAERIAVTVIITSLPTVTTEVDITACFGSTVTLEATPSTGTINWYTDATGGTPIATGTALTTTTLTEDTVYYTEAEYNGCPSAERTAIHITVIPLPEAGDDETILFCENDTALLDAQIEGDVTYLWDSGETTPQITIDEAGIYTVTITNTSECIDTQTFTTDIILAPDIDVVQIRNTDEATIIMEDNTQDYEYSIDGINYQSSPIFRGLKDGIYAAYARSLNGCGLDIKTFRVLLVQKYFTPNNDGINDAFTIAGMATAYPQATVTVFDRYGKIITGLNRYNREWDGTYNGNKLPATDYWYIIQLNSTSPEIKGHVSLVR